MEYFIIAALMLVSVFCAFVSSLVTSLSKDDINHIFAEDTSGKADKFKKHLDDQIKATTVIESFLYTGAAVATGLTVYVHSLNWYVPILAVIALFVIYVIIRTFFSGLGKRFSLSGAAIFLPVFSLMSILTKPIIMIIELIDRKISGLASEEASREDLTAMFDTAREEGAIEADEYRILKNIMLFSDVFVSDVMTPRTVVFSLEADKTVGEVAEMSELMQYSRFPIWEGESLDDDVVGYVLSADILRAALTGKSNTKLRSLSREVYIIPENAELDDALDMFLRRRQHQFVVVDEYGGVEGLITMEDVLETILGVEIVDEVDKVVDLRMVAKQRRDKRIASLTGKSIEELNPSPDKNL